MIPVTWFISEGVEIEQVELGESEPKPEYPAECWQETPVDPQRAWDAVVAMCK